MSDRAHREAILADTTRAYRRFAEREACGRSPLYEAIAKGVAVDAEVLGFLLTLPREKRQPNLLLAAVRSLFGTPADWPDFRRRLMAGHDLVKQLMLRRSTQTNEPARCATLLPVLALLPQPLALIEVGASAGLCLLPDCYGYDYERVQVRPNASAPVFRCAADAATPLPAAVPEVAWRVGLDLHPLDVAEPEDRAWLEALVWPEQTGRLEGLRAAMEVAREVEPRIVAGDLRTDLASLAEEAPLGATLVVFHTAVLAYVASSADREAFTNEVRRLSACWIANELPTVFPGIGSRATADASNGRFLLSVDGAPTAWTDSHGAALEWITVVSAA